MRRSSKLDVIKTVTLHLMLWTLLGGLWGLAFIGLRFLSTIFVSSVNDWLDWPKWMPVAIFLAWLIGVITSALTNRPTLGYFSEVHFTLGGVSVLLGWTIGAIGGILLEILTLLVIALIPGMTTPASSLGWLPNLSPLGALLGIVLALASLAIFGASMIHDTRKKRIKTSRRGRSQSRLERLPGPVQSMVIFFGTLLPFFLMVCYLITLFLVNTLHNLQDRR